MDLMDLYNRAPIFLQNIICSFEGMRIQKSRFSADFWRIFEEYEERSDWSHEMLCEFRDRRLRAMVKHCYETVPYYNRLFKQFGINYESIKSIEDLKVLPILTKSIVKENYENLISSSYKGKIMKVNTSGTTGSGLQVLCSPNTIHEQFAAFWRARRKIGIEMNEWCALFGGRGVVPQTQTQPPFWRINKPGKQIYFSVYHINEENVEAYLLELERKKIKWIHGYPSSLNLIANYMISKGRKLSHNIKYITTGSENLMPHQKYAITEAFGVAPYEHYGQAENVAIFSERKDHKIFVDEDFSAVEFIKDSNTSMYKVVGTSLINFAMPLLRYETGDIVEMQESGHGRELLSIDGRKEDYIVLTNGTRVGRLAHIFSKMVNISESQIIQKEIGEITIKIVKGNHYTIKDEEQLIRSIHTKIGETEKINLEYVDEISRTKNGKLRFVVSELN